AVRRPARLLGIGEIDDRNWSLMRNRVQTRPLTKRELQFIVPSRMGVAGSQCSAIRTVEDDGYRCRVNVEEHDAHLAQTGGGVCPTPSVDGGHKLLVDRHIQPNSGVAADLPRGRDG